MIGIGSLVEKEGLLHLDLLIRKMHAMIRVTTAQF